MANLFSKWKNGLARSRKSTFGQIASLLGAAEITDETWDELEALLIQADLGIETTEAVLSVLREQVREEGMVLATDLRNALWTELRSRLDTPPQINLPNHPSIILIVGVNGSGKTTSIAKLGKRYSDQGYRVLLGAADTFRAAAVDQLQIWAERVNLPVISGQPGADAGAEAPASMRGGGRLGSGPGLVTKRASVGSPLAVTMRAAVSLGHGMERPPLGRSIAGRA